MLEIALVLGALLALGVVGLGALAPMSLLTALGLLTLGVGLAVGVPTGLWYHVVLYRVVSRKTVVPRRWWLAPAALHAHLTTDEERRVRPWYRIGGVGFVLCLVGGLGAIAALLIGR
jgi:hypothetical protein